MTLIARIGLMVLLLAPVLAVAEEPTAVTVKSTILRLIDEADAPARDAGVVTAIAVREGQIVKRGELLGSLDDAEAAVMQQAAEVNRAIAREKAAGDVAVRSAQAARKVAAAELRRSEESIAKFPKSVSQSQLDVERLQLDQMALEQEQAEQEQKLAKLELDLREAEFDAAQLRLKHRRIVAPIDGMVVEVVTRLGEWLEPGQKAMRLVGVDRLKAEGFVSADEATKLKTGDQAWVTIHLQGGQAKRFTGRLVFVSPEVDPINDQVRVWAEIENRGGLLRPGQRAAMIVTPGSPISRRDTVATGSDDAE